MPTGPIRPGDATRAKKEDLFHEKATSLPAGLAGALALTGCTGAANNPDITAAPTPTQEAAATPEPAEAASYTPGTYTATAQGRNGMMTVEVTFDEAGITEIQIPEHSETQIISDPAFERVPANIIEYQSLQMDTVTGATISQFAIISAVADAIAQAGGRRLRVEEPRGRGHCCGPGGGVFRRRYRCGRRRRGPRGRGGGCGCRRFRHPH